MTTPKLDWKPAHDGRVGNSPCPNNTYWADVGKVQWQVFLIDGRWFASSIPLESRKGQQRTPTFLKTGGARPRKAWFRTASAAMYAVECHVAELAQENETGSNGC